MNEENTYKKAPLNLCETPLVNHIHHPTQCFFFYSALVCLTSTLSSSGSQLTPYPDLRHDMRAANPGPFDHHSTLAAYHATLSRHRAPVIHPVIITVIITHYHRLTCPRAPPSRPTGHRLSLVMLSPGHISRPGNGSAARAARRRRPAGQTMVRPAVTPPYYNRSPANRRWPINHCYHLFNNGLLRGPTAHIFTPVMSGPVLMAATARRPARVTGATARRRNWRTSGVSGAGRALRGSRSVRGLPTGLTANRQ